METKELEDKVLRIVSIAAALKNKHTSEVSAPVNYACIFSQSDSEYKLLSKTTLTLGKVIKETPSGLLFLLYVPIETISGKLVLLKIRKHYATHPEEGDADFTVSNYLKFKKNYITKNGFKLIPREGYEMIELTDKEFNVRAYFSNPTIDKILGV